MGSSREQRLNDAIDRDDWATARALLEIELREKPDSHWLLTRLSLTYYEERNYAKALEISQQAMKLMPTCPLVRWDYAGALETTDCVAEAIAVWQGLVAQGAASIARDPCGEGRPQARSLVADCQYRLAKAFADERDLRAAIRYMQIYLKAVNSGVSSIYDRDEAEAMLASWQKKSS
jgi:predicted Zn-dependent protease